MSLYESSEDAAQGPQIYLVVILLNSEKQLRTLEGPSGHSDVVLVRWQNVFSETPVYYLNQRKPFCVPFKENILDDNVSRFQVTMEYSSLVRTTQTLRLTIQLR